MDVDTVEREALKLSEAERARLARELLDSLEHVPPQNVERLWLDEAATRASQIDAGAVDLVDGEDVERKARALLG
jgi:hypothetical protein